MPDHPLFASPYLSRLASQADTDIFALSSDEVRSGLESIIASLERGDAPEAKPDSYLRNKKQAFALLWARAELDGFLDFETLGELQTRFAESTIRFALYHAWRHPRVLKAIDDPDRHEEGEVPGLFLLGLGKLGGYDLNFSSDIDLIAFYDPDIVGVRAGQGKTDICTRVLGELTRMLSEHQPNEFVWRVDWRLRPEASSSSLAMTVSAAEEFYFYRSVPWHRLALIKARVIAGDREVGERFLADIKPYVWPRNLDYRMSDELRHLKNRINLEHPGLKAQRRQDQQITKDAVGCNVKLGRGCIREIEFIANAQQLVWGGRKPEIQITNTLKVLRKLSEEGLLPQTTTGPLAEAYRYLRTLEDRLQMLQNAQTQILPDKEGIQRQLLVLMGLESWRALEEALYMHRTRVAKAFDGIFLVGEDATEGNSELPAWSQELQGAANSIVEEWDAGFQLYGVPNTMAVALEPLFRRLLQLVSENASDHAEAIHSIDSFFKSLPPGGQYFRMLCEFPKLLESIVPPLISSPPMTSLLSQSPHIADALVEPDSTPGVTVFKTSVDAVMHDSGYEQRMEGLRRFINEQLYSVYLGFVSGTISPGDMAILLTMLAETALSAGIRTVCDYLELDSSPISILGLGKLGMGAMAPLSDLDLIYIVKEQGDIDLANRFSSRLQTVMATPMREGRVYEMDMRLRPSGRSGSPTLGLASFRRHHLERARTWEHQALVTARHVAGDDAAGSEAMEIREGVLTRPRSRIQLLNDTHKMLYRIRKQKIQDDGEQSLRVKLRPGGMLETDYLANSLILLNAARFPELIQGDYNAALARITEVSGHADLYEIILFWRALQNWVRLLGLED